MLLQTNELGPLFPQLTAIEVALLGAVGSLGL